MIIAHLLSGRPNPTSTGTRTRRRCVPRDCARSDVCPSVRLNRDSQGCPIPWPVWSLFSTSSTPATCSSGFRLFHPNPRISRCILPRVSKLFVIVFIIYPVLMHQPTIYLYSIKSIRLCSE